MALAAIRKSNYRHFMSLFAVVPHTKEHIQNYMIKFINTLWIDFRFTLRKMRNLNCVSGSAWIRLLITPWVSLHIIRT
ncbi:hypothetical protein M989_02155 [Kluyvera georgiana ATCC 51603]|uniref:Uncharacterized protein n=1 Tax=Kluyvera georgiana ATCC 51603 TaxID=1354264 RepID=A0A1B7JYY2_9ENTR|nr:hypothetical protein M989_02155 [Kluyvera georgiana ATCC 51603]